MLYLSLYSLQLKTSQKRAVAGNVKYVPGAKLLFLYSTRFSVQKFFILPTEHISAMHIFIVINKISVETLIQETFFFPLGYLENKLGKFRKCNKKFQKGRYKTNNNIYI